MFQFMREVLIDIVTYFLILIMLPAVLSVGLFVYFNRGRCPELCDSLENDFGSGKGVALAFTGSALVWIGLYLSAVKYISFIS